MLEQKLLERLRPLAVNQCCWEWDYAILWKLSDDHRCLELMDCICPGTQNTEETAFSAAPPPSPSTALPCRDVSYSHPRIDSCDLLDNVPSSLALDSGVHAEALLSNHYRWLNFSFNSDTNASQETLGTRVLVPLPGGLIELFAIKNVPEHKEVMDFISQCSMISEEQALTESCCADSSFSLGRVHEIPTRTSLANAHPLQKALNVFRMQNLAVTSAKNMDKLSHDVSSIGRNLQQFSSTSEIENKSKNICVEGIYGSSLFIPSSGNRFHEMESSKRNAVSNVSGLTEGMEEPSCTIDKNPFVEENNKSDYSDPNNGDENEGKYRKRIGKGHQSKNLEAERKRRKKLNDKLYSLRALVPNISKLDRTAILGDAVHYVKELKKQAEDLQMELEDHSDDESAMMLQRKNIDNTTPLVTINQRGSEHCAKREHEIFQQGSSRDGGSNAPKISHKEDKMDEKNHGVEPKVEVFQVDGNEFFIKVFFEHKAGGFVRLTKALSTLGLQIINVNVTRHSYLVSSVFTVEKRENATIQADHVKKSLLKLA